MVIRLLKKVITNVARGKIKVKKVELRKKLNAQRAIAKREAQVKVFIENGEKAAALIQSKGIEKLNLNELKKARHAMLLEVSNFDKSCAVRLGGHWANVQHTLLAVNKKIQELENQKEWWQRQGK